MVTLSQKSIQEFKDIFEKDMGKEITWDEASSAARDMVGLYEILFRLHVEELKRKEKLKEFPDGFIIDGIGRNCPICGNGSTEEGSWYDKYGIKCFICRDSINRKEIPPTLSENRENWYSKFDLESCFNLKGPTLRSWIKKGIIKARTVTRDGGGIHTQVFLIKDNKDFLPPKELVKSKAVKESKDGKEWISSRPWYAFVDPFEHLKGYKIMEYMNNDGKNKI